MAKPIYCKRCGGNQCYIQSGPDGKIVFCPQCDPRCEFGIPVKHFFAKESDLIPVDEVEIPDGFRYCPLSKDWIHEDECDPCKMCD